MNRFDNPFHDLWITEILSPTEFVRMFSPYVAAQAEELFGTGNVVVKGRQGSGKSMLLGLLNTKTRIAYARSQEAYPAPDRYKKFIAAGTHLIRDNVRIVASRLSEIPSEKRYDWASTTFADYLNYVLLRDLLKNVTYLESEQKKDNVLSDFVNINFSENRMQLFIEKLKSSQCWYGYLDSCESWKDIQDIIESRLSSYRRYFNFNTDKLDDSIETTKTDIGEPIAVFSDCLRDSGIIPPKTLVYLRIDQHEELYELEKTSGHAQAFRQVINRALAMRDGRVAYRVGTRHYAWNSNTKIWGSGADLENMRDYSIIDIDGMLKKHEHGSPGINFSDFAEDVFCRRLESYGFELNPSQKENILSDIFGNTMSPHDRAKIYAKKKQFKLKIPESWSKEWHKALKVLWEENPLDAKFGVIWLSQKQQQQEKLHLSHNPDKLMGWRDKPYWIKERNEAALVQIAGDTNEMLIWSGKRHIVDLAGWNILAFMTICRSIWGAWLRRTSDEELSATYLPRINVDQQVIGIHDASRVWAEKLKEGADGDLRFKFINSIGSWISFKIRSDKALSYPGHTGFSLDKMEFEKPNDIIEVIKSCRDQGDLIESEHTTKSSNGKPRIKWYLNPLLCPYFRIPHIRTKEPIYTNLNELEKVQTGARHQVTIDLDDEPPMQEELF